MRIHISDTTNSLLVNCSDSKYVTEERIPAVIHHPSIIHIQLR